ncbi:MAG: flagellar hook-associated protein FlgL [Dehalococcoidia bacterium]|nr:flagellar hook-associated protein FlgL [Dehalococcoidia bacterium]MCA9849676.1 flagellar hook-associated protein FlgL [Dehalococcoidia bacterium]MCA9855870.1 flagellar hook-associated protein FlgL [Dehalococcoidia bacterium]MCB9492057.1 flagellar hook-associated protein FlgL [Dehalococcoidia bacterium]
MRISNRSTHDRLLQHIQQATTRLNETQERVASGRKINRPSDDPFATARALASRSKLDTVSQRIRTVDLATTELSAVESSLTSLGNVITRAQELAVQADSAGVNGDARQQIATEVEQLLNEVLSIANTSYSGRRIFGGHQGGAPFAPDLPANPTAFNYSGDSGQVLREIGDGETIAVNIDGEPLFDGIFASLIAFRDGLVANDRTAINFASGDIGREIDTVLTARGEVGSRMRRLEMTADRLGEEELALRTSISGLEEVDLTQEVVELQMRDTAFQASLSATARSLGTSLLDFLR